MRFSFAILFLMLFPGGTSQAMDLGQCLLSESEREIEIVAILEEASSGQTINEVRMGKLGMVKSARDGLVVWTAPDGKTIAFPDQEIKGKLWTEEELRFLGNALRDRRPFRHGHAAAAERQHRQYYIDAIALYNPFLFPRDAFVMLGYTEFSRGADGLIVRNPATGGEIRFPPLGTTRLPMELFPGERAALREALENGGSFSSKSYEEGRLTKVGFFKFTKRKPDSVIKFDYRQLVKAGYELDKMKQEKLGLLRVFYNPSTRSRIRVYFQNDDELHGWTPDQRIELENAILRGRNFDGPGFEPPSGGEGGGGAGGAGGGGDDGGWTVPVAPKVRRQ